MTELRAAGEPGRHTSGMAHFCGWDGGDDTAPPCGVPATWHLFAGSVDGPGEWCMFACDVHVTPARNYSWDWHPLAPVCGVPGSMWTSRAYAGQGFCWWPEAEAAIHETVTEDARV